MGRVLMGGVLVEERWRGADGRDDGGVLMGGMMEGR